MMITSCTSFNEPPQAERSPLLRATTEKERIDDVRCSASCGVGARHGSERRLVDVADELRSGQRAWLALDRLQLGRLDAGDPVLLESPRLGENLPLERADRLVVRVDCAAQGASELGEVRPHGRQALVELTSEVG